MDNYSYALVTAAKNEEKHIERAITAVISQTVLPVKWIIVDDSSTDKTAETIKSYVEKYDFIELLSTDDKSTRSFGSKAIAFSKAYEYIRRIKFEYIGNLDADISFESNYYETMLHKFKNNKRLGIVGGVRLDYCNGKFVKTISSRNSVGGPIQLFSRQCFEVIGGYMPLKYGGIDAVAEITARMQGWEVESFPEITVYHHRPTGSASGSFLNSRLRYGKKFYVIGYHPFFYILMVLRRMLLLRFSSLGGPLEILGYLWAGLCRYKRPVSDDFVNYLRSEQLARLKLSLFNV